MGMCIHEITCIKKRKEANRVILPSISVGNERKEKGKKGGRAVRSERKREGIKKEKVGITKQLSGDTLFSSL